jgi:hypothetical protein
MDVKRQLEREGEPIEIGENEDGSDLRRIAPAFIRVSIILIDSRHA